MKFVLDTDVISQLSKERPNAGVLRWINQQDDSDLYLSATTLAEIRFGVELVAKGRRRAALEDWLVNELPAKFSGRILPVERHVADLAGRILARSRQEGWEIKAMDAFIGATAMANDMGLATLNRKHFERLGVELAEFG